jgi:hypothetical protein
MVFNLAKGVRRPWQGRHVRAAFGGDFRDCFGVGEGNACKLSASSALIYGETEHTKEIFFLKSVTLVFPHFIFAFLNSFCRIYERPCNLKSFNFAQIHSDF